MLARVENWDLVLAEYIEETRKRAFAYGSFDCCLFAADWVRRLTGIDFAADLRGYQNETEARAIIERYGTVEAMVTSLLGFEPVHASQARRGDILIGIQLAQPPETLGVCLGVHCAVPGPDGLVFPRTLAMRWTYRIG